MLPLEIEALALSTGLCLLELIVEMGTTISDFLFCSILSAPFEKDY
jgi:hypothetical protein